jgi:predicted enzyme related to lactoylglutathione lyase
MLKGFATSACYAADLEAAEAWYSTVLGIDAYFHVPGYIEFRVGRFEAELGIIDAKYAPEGGHVAGGAYVQWAVDDVAAALERLLELGATLYQPVIERGSGFITAAVIDPFGNILAFMENPHFEEILKRADRAA